MRRNITGRATMAALGIIPAAVLATAGTVTASSGTDPLYADGHKHATYADWSPSTTAKAPTRQPGARPDLLDAHGNVIPLSALRKSHWRPPRRTDPLSPPIPTIVAKPVARNGGPTTRTGAAALTTWTHSCNTVPGRFASPPPPAAGNPFGVARAARNPISGTWQGWLQGEATLPGQGQAAVSPNAWVNYSVVADNPSIPGMTVSVSVLPMWHGAMQLSSTGFNVAFSSATGSFRSAHGWFNETLNRWDSIGEIRTQTRTVQDGAQHFYPFDKGTGTGTFTVGDNLPVGQRLTYTISFETQVSLQTQPAAPAAAVTDFGSAGLDTPANMVTPSGTQVRGYYDAGTKPVTGIIKTTWKSTSRDFTLACL